ncbi:MAG TPA: metal ABC transporter permease [Clostridiaceae bacterium]|nr:metal ABC transporter permease [Clostridiaceae bacterium]
MTAQFEIQLIAVSVAIACALPGVFLVLRQMAMMSDAITHTILLGIVLGFFITHDLNSPWLIVGAALIGVVTVWLTELLSKTRLLAEDSAIGIVFPLLFSIAIILITRYAGAVHLDTDAVLLGELAFAPFDRMIVAGIDIGPKALIITAGLVILNLGVISIFFKELKLATFDPVQAAVLGIAPAVIHYGLMTLVSLTAVGSFQAVGSILVVAFMIGPPITAYLLTDDLKKMLILSALLGAFNGIAGFQLAIWLDVSIAGSMALMTGISFLLVFIFAPDKGMLSALIRRKKQRIEFAKMTVLFHLLNHEGSDREAREAGMDTIPKELNWDKSFTENIIKLLQNEQRVELLDGVIKLTLSGRIDSRRQYDALFQSD